MMKCLAGEEVFGKNKVEVRECEIYEKGDQVKVFECI